LSYPEIWLAEIVAGAPFFFGEADADCFGVSAGETVALGLAEGDSSGDGEGVGEALRFFFLLALGEDSGEGVGDDFFFFGEGEVVGSGVSDGVGVADVFFFFGEGDFSGVSLGLGVGDFSAVVFFFVCLRGVGVGLGSKIFFSLLPNDSSAGARSALKPIDARTKSATAVLIVRRMTAGDQILFRKLSENGLVKPNSGFQILERKIFVRRMGAAIRERQSQ
jgi:hypothetical protein